MIEKKVTGGVGPLYEAALAAEAKYEEGMTFNAKGSVKSGWGTATSEACGSYYTGTKYCLAGFTFATNTAPVSYYVYPYSFKLINNPQHAADIHVASQSWVDWGSVAGDENFLSPAVYQIRAVQTSASTPPSGPSPQWSPYSDTAMLSNYIDLNTSRDLTLRAQVGDLGGGVMSAVLSVTVREKAHPSTNTVTETIRLAITFVDDWL